MHVGLVIAQFLLAAAIVLSARWAPPDLLPIVLSLPGMLVAIWAWHAMGVTNIRVAPAPDQRSRLVRHGPYRWIRHPMYTGLLLFTMPLLASNFAWWRLLAWMALVLVLRIKAAEEERLMGERFSEYRSYLARTGRFFPKLG